MIGPRNRPSLFIRLRTSEEGAALVLTLGIASVLAILVTTVLAVTLTAQRSSATDSREQEALAAAMAGVEDYLYRLNNGDEYWRFPAEGTPPDGNLAFDDFVPIPGAVDRGEFTYSVDAASLVSHGILFLESTGRVNTEQRTIRVQMAREGFLQFVYFTDYETSPPIAYGPNQANIDWAEANCSTHRYASPPRHPSCTNIYFANGDTINGPFHTNDTFLVAGSPTWLQQPITASSTDSPMYQGSGTPNFAAPGLSFHERYEMPPTNLSIKAEADQALGGEGCLFTGPTAIEFSGGNMLVESPYTLDAGSGCGTWPGAGVQSVPIPANGVVYVQNVPASQGVSCTAGDNGLGYPRQYDNGDMKDYSCLVGDAFVEGTVDGRVTVASENDVIITWHLLRDDQGADTDDIVGLVAQNSVMVYHPTYLTDTSSGRHCGNTYSYDLYARPNHDAYFVDPQIDAAMLAVTGSFIVPNYRCGRNVNNGTLNVTGTIAQTFRGPVGTFSGSSQISGYDKNYVYDQRLRYQAPPHFLNPVDVEWAVVRQTECLADNCG